MKHADTTFLEHVSLEQAWVSMTVACLAQVYGDPLEHPQKESYWGNVNCIGERSCYDEGKRAAECLTLDYHREHGMDVSAPFSWFWFSLHIAASNRLIVRMMPLLALSGDFKITEKAFCSHLVCTEMGVFCRAINPSLLGVPQCLLTME